MTERGGDTVADWLARYAEALEVQPLTGDEVRALLELARDVAHGTERRFAPLSTFLAGVRAGRASQRGEEVAGAVARARQLLADTDSDL